jgi:bifunctional N-acetylglucosamine-1-phosphate-uridyltransferase/glucosamine-1-phosphate-acetyltransferase GlmU-like protein
VSGAVGRNKPCSNIVDKRGDVPVLCGAIKVLDDAVPVLFNAVLVLCGDAPVLCSPSLSALRRADKASSFSAASGAHSTLTCKYGVTTNGRFDVVL